MATNHFCVEEEAPEFVQVYLRLKPSKVKSKLYEVRSDRHLVASGGDATTSTGGHGRRVQHNVSKLYTFSHIFKYDANQQNIFEHVVIDKLRKLPDGHNFTLLAYGASGSGKTYTLMGTVTSPGLVPRSLEYVFTMVDAAQSPLYRPGENGATELNQMQRHHELQQVCHLRQVPAPLREKYRRMSSRLAGDMEKSTRGPSARTKHYIWVSFVEIYNEGIYDLLVAEDRTASSKLKIREDTNGNVYVQGAKQVFVRTGEEAYDILVVGKHNLQVHATGVHAQSSRSHCIFTITMLTQTENGVRSSYVRLCDLAGSERASRTGNTGARMKESKSINTSLHVLERCLHMLRRKQAHAPIPYRESKLTRLLGAGLSGKRGEAVTMVVTVNPAPEFVQETRHVLSLAAVARDIHMNTTVAGSKLDNSSDTSVGAGAELAELQAENVRLQGELEQSQSLAAKVLAEMAAIHKEQVAEARADEVEYFTAQLNSIKLLHDVELAGLREEAAGNKQGADGPPSPSSQAEMRKEISNLKEALVVEQLAKAQLQRELESLRRMVQNIHEKSDDVLVHLTDEEQTEEDSLEPTFKQEELNRSLLFRRQSNVEYTVPDLITFEESPV